MTEARPYKVEGVGEDIIPGTTHFEYIDDVITISDKESFNTARKLAREEGIFIGGSGGLAAAAALKVAQSLPAGKMVVVLFPDSGVKYLTTFYSDDWMQENRFFDFEKISLTRVLQVKANNIPGLISVDKTDPVREAYKKMKEFHISQLPVLHKGKSVGSIVEGTVMDRVLQDTSMFEKPVENIMDKSFPVVDSKRSIEEVKGHLSQKSPAVLIEESGKLIGIITKSDLLEFIAA